MLVTVALGRDALGATKQLMTTKSRSVCRVELPEDRKLEKFPHGFNATAA